jgi:glycogen(starch) synthase
MLADRGHDITVFSGTPAPTHRTESFFGATVCRLPCTDRRRFSTVAVPALVVEHERTPFDAAEIPDLFAEGAGLRAHAPALPIIMRAHTPLYIPTEIDFHALPTHGRWLSALRRLLGGLRHRKAWRQTLREARARISFKNYFDPTHDSERAVAIEADLIVPPSRRLAERLLADWSLPNDRIRILPYAHLPAESLLALHPPEKLQTIGFHGSIRYFKGVNVLLGAMPTVLERHPETRLVLAGASGATPLPDMSFGAWKRDRMLEWHDTYTLLKPQLRALGDRVLMRGFVPPDQLASHLAAVDICVFPSLFDNFPSACLEAMSAARPIIATRSGGMQEMLDEGAAGVLVKPKKVNQLAQAICRLIENPDLARTLSVRARARLRDIYSGEAVGPLHEAIYREAIDLRRAA